MNDRMKIAARMMAARYWTNDPIDRDARAREAVADADALLKALAESEVEQAPNGHDEVGNWREYVRLYAKRALMRVANGDLSCVDRAFYWALTPQGSKFWRAIEDNDAAAADKTRAQDFARRVLEAMEVEGE